MKEFKKYIQENSELNFEMNQLNEIKDFVVQINEDLKNYNDNYELKEISQIKNSFEKNVDNYIHNSTDINFQKVLNEIKSFIKGKNIEIILDSLVDIFKDIESNFYVDESLDLVSYCWGIQNGHDEILDF